MKRSSCLSAVLLGLSLTSTSVALADPAPSESGTAPKLVAQAKPNPSLRTLQTSDSTTTAGGTNPTAAPADGTNATATPAAAGTTAVLPAVADTTTPGATDPAKKPKPRPWAGTQVYAMTSMSTATIFRGQQQSYNPTVDTAVMLLPRYAINDAFQLRGRLIFSYEYTNSDTTVTRNEPRFSDTTLQLFYRKIPVIPGLGAKPMVALNMGLPTSPESRARTMVVAPGVTLQLSKSVEKVLGGELMFLVSGIYSHPFYRSTTPEVRTPVPYSFQCFGGNGCQDQLSGVFNVSDSISYAALIAGEWGKWSPALYYLGVSQWAYTGSDARNPVDGTPVQASADFRPSNVRQTSYFSAWLDYNANAWLTAEVGYSLSRTALTESGERANPFFDRYQDMRVYVGANFNIDNIMKQLEGGTTEAGIVRAKNTKQPMWRY